MYNLKLYKKIGIVYVACMLSIAGCSQKNNSSSAAFDESNIAVASNETEAKGSIALETTIIETSIEETTVVETTVVETTTEEETTTIEETTIDEEWENGKLSGSLEDYEKYFQQDITDWFKTNEQAGEVKEITYHSNYLDSDRQAYVYTPYGYDESNTYPVMYLIHGIGCDKGQWVSMSATKLFDNMIAEGKLKPFVAVFPSVIPVGGLDKETLSANNINAFVDFVQEFKEDLVPYMEDNYHVSDKREDNAICGLSMGGMEALRVGFTYLDKFDFIGSFSAAPTLETELLKTEEYVPTLVLLCSGDKDSTVGNNPEKYHDKLTENGVDHIWYYHPGQNHSPSVWKLGLYNFIIRLSGGFVD